MCLMAMAWDCHPRWPLVLVANRDEFHRRPSLEMHWWEEGSVLAGRDLEAGGTWLGISRRGRIGLLTNVREPGRHQDGRASRGLIVPAWLQPEHNPQTLQAHLAAQAFNGFNLIGVDLQTRQAHWWTNRPGTASPQAPASALALKPGVHGLSNAALNTPWPKLERLRGGLARHLAVADRSSSNGSAGAGSPADQLEALLELLTDRHQPEDHALPQTGVSMQWERLLSRIFIQTPDAAYGTRCSTVIVVERMPPGVGVPSPWQLWVLEQTWDAQGQPIGRVQHHLPGPQAAGV